MIDIDWMLYDLHGRQTEKAEFFVIDVKELADRAKTAEALLDQFADFIKIDVMTTADDAIKYINQLIKASHSMANFIAMSCELCPLGYRNCPCCIFEFSKTSKIKTKCVDAIANYFMGEVEDE